MGRNKFSSLFLRVNHNIELNGETFFFTIFHRLVLHAFHIAFSSDVLRSAITMKVHHILPSLAENVVFIHLDRQDVDFMLYTSCPEIHSNLSKVRPHDYSISLQRIKDVHGLNFFILEQEGKK